MRSRVSVVVSALLLLDACGSGSVLGPSLTNSGAAAATFNGNYALTLRAAAACALSVSQYQWSVVASTVDAGGGVRSVTVTLPSGNGQVEMSFLYGSSGDPAHAIGNFDTIAVGEGAPISGTNLLVGLNGVVNGTVSARSGRGQVLDGTMQGDLVVLQPGERYLDEPGCTAGNHSWTLSPQ